MAIAPVSATSSSASFGLDFQSLLKIILTQLTYQDPLKPVDNFEFISQLAQFSQLQQTQQLNDSVTSLLAAQSATQATSLFGRTVDFKTGPNTIVSGVVTGVSFVTGTPKVTIETASGTISNLSIADISQVRATEGE